jgi:hypothetical protein
MDVLNASLCHHHKQMPVPSFLFSYFFLLFSKADRVLAKTFSEKLQERILVPSSAVLIKTSHIKQRCSSSVILG